MTITRAQVADLQPGDVVELAHAAWPEGSTIRGPLYQQKCSDGLYCCGFQATNPAGGLYHPSFWREFTVVSRAPRPLYVNHPRAEPVPGDVVRDADDSARSRVWIHLPHLKRPREPWVCQSGNEPIRRGRSVLPARLTLLVDGTTGEVVP